jgi:hypothetical protein
MPDRENDREPRWTNTGYWTDRDEADDREGDHSLSRSYGSDDQRRYARQSQDQADRLRRLRGEPRNHGRARQERARSREERGGYFGGRSRGGSDPGYQRPRQQWQGREERDDWPERGGWRAGPRIRWDSRPDDTDTPEFDWNTGDERGRNLVDNYWGERERRRRYGRPGPERGYFSVRDYGQREDRGGQDWYTQRDYDMDPGFGYEFGTDYDWMQGRNMEPQRQRNRQYPLREGRWQRMGGANRGARLIRERQPREQEDRTSDDWNAPGPYRGMGPSGYRRSDERIREDICEIFTQNGQMDPSNVEIAVQDGEVILQGSVDSKLEKRLAENIAASIPGVKDVTNRIRVKGNRPNQTTI